MENKIKVKEHAVFITAEIGRVTALVTTPPEVQAVLVLAHGAGAGMTHPFMEKLALALAALKTAVVRFNFPYIESGGKRPDQAQVAERTVAQVIEFAHELFPQTPLFTGGKSFGGRMTSQRLSRDCPPYVKGIVFFGFPLHPTGQPSTTRAVHLEKVAIPMLFLQGTKDTLALPDLIEGVVAKLPTARLVKFEGADHSFNRGKENNIPLLASTTEEWIKACTI